MRTSFAAFLSLVVVASPALARNDYPRPFDWVSHAIPMTDSRPWRTHAPKDCSLEIIELEYRSSTPKRGAVLMIPGLFHHAYIFDLAPEANISYARWLMHEHGLQVYMLNVRNEGVSCYLSRSTLDDISIDDIPAAIRFVADELEHERIFVLGHSQGSITLQSSLAGITRCASRKNCFDSKIAHERQSRVRAAALFAGNVTMKSTRRSNPLLPLAIFDTIADPLAAPFIDSIPASWLTSKLSPTESGHGPASGDKSAAYSDIWEVVYHLPNVSREAREAWYNRTLDRSSTRILRQYARGIKHGGLRASSGELYADHLKNIVVPAATATFEFDILADAESTRQDDHERLGSPSKELFYFAGEGHEDFLLNADFHAHHAALWAWLFRNAN